MKLTINTKQGWISSLSWSDNSPFMLACAAYDATIKVIDIRAQAPLYTVKEAAQDSKVLCCKWRSGWLVSGGEDSVLHIRSCA
jgi:WD40 repeat protein